MSGKPVLLPELFTGESHNWTEWFEHFQSVAEVNKWATSEEKLKWLRVRLTAKAQTAYRRLPQNVRENYGECVKALKTRFDPDSKRELYVAELHTRARKREEDWASYGDALRTLADKAYGDLEEKARERLALTQFLAHIENPQVAFGVRQKRPETVEAAVVATIELESYLGCYSSVQRDTSAAAGPAATPIAAVNSEPLLDTLKLLNERLEKLEVLVVSRADSSSHKQHVDAARENKWNGLTCWNCGRKGHIARNCRNRRNTQSQGKFNPSDAWASHPREDN